MTIVVPVKDRPDRPLPDGPGVWSSTTAKTRVAVRGRDGCAATCRGGPGAARNDALAHVRTELVAFLD